jgi:nicotinamide-nucleotide amidase
MRIEVINTGSELLLGLTLNTHLSYLAAQLAARGLRITRQTTIADDPAEMRVTFAAALERSDLILITGGLGPTSDDITRDIIAEVLQRPLRLDPAVADTIRERFRKRGRQMPEKNLVQAMVPAGATVLPNPNGTAPGLSIEHHGKKIFLLPGPPRELRPMFENYVFPQLPGAPVDCRIFKTATLPESQVEQLVAPALAGLADLELGYCARPGEVEVRVIGLGAAAAEEKIRAVLGDHIFATGHDRMEDVILRQLAGKTVATAESCTGGLIAHRLTNVSGSSAVFLAGYVTYSNAAKIRDLGVREETLEKFGAVSEQVAREMAEGARRRAGTDYALSATGIAGPTGGTPDKPVGLVYIGLVTPTGTTVQKHTLHFDRETFKFFVSQAALDMLRRELTKPGGGLRQPALPKLVGRAAPSAPLPRRKKISHDLPAGVRPEDAVFFLTICCAPRGENQLCKPDVAAAIFESVEVGQVRGDWWMQLVVLMPDHLHALLVFPAEKNLRKVIADWKKLLARKIGIRWQRDFFDHRIREEERLQEKADYILKNPVRAGLIVRAEDWPYVWLPEQRSGGLRQPALPEPKKSNPVGRAAPSAPKTTKP